MVVVHYIKIPTGICAALIVGMSILSLRLKFLFRTSALIMAGIALVSELSKIFSDMEFVNGIDGAEGMCWMQALCPFIYVLC